MAKLVTKFKYLKPGSNAAGKYVKYIATREGVEMIDDSKKYAPATVKQKQFIEKMLLDFPDAAESLEYADYIAKPNRINASELISRTMENNIDVIADSKTYADYIATRPRTQKFGSHGLFTDDGVAINLSKVSEELKNHNGNVWTMIVSLHREDAERLGFNRGERWRDMLRTQVEQLSTNLKIPMKNLRWYAAFHNESHHPHIHLIAYSVVENEGYLTRQGIERMRSSLASDIFQQDLISVYEKQTEHRRKIKESSKDIMDKIVSQINSGIYDNPLLEEKLLLLADKLSRTSGKKVYGYLKADVKSLIDSITDLIADDERVSKLYDLWYENKFSIIRTYTDELPDKIPLSQNKEFKSVKNMIIFQAMNIALEKDISDNDDDIIQQSSEEPLDDINEDLSNEPTEYDEETDRYPYNDKLWWTSEYKEARKYLYGTKTETPDFEKALLFLKVEAERGNGFAMHDLAKMYLSGLGCSKDERLAQEWFKRTFEAFIEAEKNSDKPDYLQYRIGKLYSFGYGVEQDYLKAAEWYEKAVAQGNPFAAYSLGSLYLRGQGVEENAEKAYELFVMAADHEEKPNAYAAYELGRMCAEGNGTDKDEKASDRWYKKAYRGFESIERNMADDKLYYRLGQMNLKGLGTKINLDKACDYFEKAADLKNIDALYGLGELYLNKDFSKSDIQKAVDYLYQAAKKNHQFAQYTLGKMHLKGEGVIQDAEYGVRWLLKAIKQNNSYAEYLLGKAILKGEYLPMEDNMPLDVYGAVELLLKSSDQGNEYASYTLGKIFIEGELLPQDISAGFELLLKATEKDCIPAWYFLGKMFYNGLGVEKDIDAAIYYFEKAVKGKNLFAAYQLGKIYSSEEGYIDMSKAIDYFIIAARDQNSFAEYQLGKIYLYGNGAEKDYDIAMHYLHLSAEHGNQYAKQLLYSIQKQKNIMAAMSSLRLLQHISNLIRRKNQQQNRRKIGPIDRKTQQKINEKMQAHGLKPSM